MSYQVSNERELFREVPVRFFGYANEIGEAFRKFIGCRLVRASYAIAALYILGDTIHQTRLAYLKTCHIPCAVFTAGDTFLWQMCASVIIPGFILCRLCRGADHLLANGFKMCASTRNSLVTAVGLLAIPFIVKPIDLLVDKAFDSTIRQFEP